MSYLTTALARRLTTRGAALSLSAVVALGPFAMGSCDDPNTYIGATYVSLYCTGAGISWSAVTQDFLPNEPITYSWEIYPPTGGVIRGQHGGYYTDGGGDHFRLPNGFPQAVDCGHGTYSIVIWTQSRDTPEIRTHADSDSVTC